MKKNNLLLLITFLFFWANSNAQSQVGSTVYFSQSGVSHGLSLSINTLGSIVAVGADHSDTMIGIQAGLVRVFEFNNNTNQWEQKGNDILGDNSGDLFGLSISLNSIGNILAIGAPTNDNDGFQTGLVKVFEFNNSNEQWEQKGNNLYSGLPDSYTGTSVSLNSLGTKLAIGTPASGVGGDGLNFGNIIVFDFDSNTNDWVKVGSNIIGTQNYISLGYSVALNNNGDTLIAGGPGIYRNGNPAINGMVQVFELVNDAWIQKGDNILGKDADDRFGGTLDINNDGNVIIVGSLLSDRNGNNSGKVDIYEYNGSEWIEKGTSILGEAENMLGSSVIIDDIGDKILIGSRGHNNSLGKVELFQFSNNNWEKLGSPILGDSTNDNFGSRSSMTPDGNYIISSSSRADDIDDYFKVFNVSNQTLNIVEQELYHLNIYFNENDLIINCKDLVINDIKVFNVLGQAIKLPVKKSSSLKIRFSDYLETGVYYIKLFTDKGVLNKKVLFKKS